MDPIKKLIVKDHEKFVTATYPQLFKRSIAVNAAGVVACYLTGLVLWKLHSKLFPKPAPIIHPDLTTIEND